MIYNICKIKNIDTADHSIAGTVLSENEELTIQDSLRISISSNEDIISKISSSKLQVGNASEYISNISDQIDWLKNDTKSVSTSYPFAAKTLDTGESLYKRVHGVKISINNETKNIELVVPYNNCKITGVEILGATLGDTANLKVLDTPTGTISTIANYMLNQFGFDVYLNKDYHKETSTYDADLIKDMKLCIEYTTSDTTKDVYANFILHEVK